MTPEQLDKANAEIEKRKRYKSPLASSPPVIPVSPVATEAANVPSKATHDVAARNAAQPIPDRAGERTSPSTPNATQNYTNTVLTTSSESRDAGDGNVINTTTDFSILDELKESIMKLSIELETNLSLSQAKRYALKKELAMERSKLIREERRLHPKN